MVAHTTRPSEPAKAGPGTAKLADIQGLRALCVIAVVLNHLTGHPVGGFVGVDVFFVISGYLITGLLAREYTRSGKISIPGFYRRRTRRLLPAAAVVTVATIATASHVFGPLRFHQTWVDGVYATVFAANWHFIAVGTNYFSAALPPSPFQHFWSLSVEEQFYLVWPVTLVISGLIALFVGRVVKSHRGNLRIVGGACAAVIVCAVSIAFAAHQTSAAPVNAYFSTFTRAWELGLGALLAFVSPHLRGRQSWLSVLSLAGLAMIVVSLFTTTSTGFPMPGALLPCVGAVLVIAAAGPAYNPLLSNRPAVLVGDASYSVYLVHFPVIIFAEAEMPGHSAYFYVVATLVICALSLALYVGVERPVLESNWLATSRRHKLDRERRDTQRLLAAAGCMLVAAYATAVYWPGTQAAYNNAYARINGSDSTPTSVPPGAATRGPLGRSLQTEIDAALKATAYPALNPTMQAALSAPQAAPAFDHCAGIVLRPASGCTWGAPNAPHTLYLVGDSTSVVYAQALSAVVAHTPGWRLRFAGAFGCKFSSVAYVNPDPTIQHGCAAHNAAAVADIKQVHPDVLVVTNLDDRGKLATTGATYNEAQGIAALEDELVAVKGSYRKAVWLANPPQSKLPDCATPGSPPAACVSSPSSAWIADKSLLQSAAHTFGATYVDPRSWFCSTSGYCPPFVGNVPTFHDKDHATTAYMAKIWPVIRESLISAGLFKQGA